MKFAYEDLSDDQFEGLVVAICEFVLGLAVQGFAPGRDGGRDARFEGRAELHPSTTDPWVGRVIIQAKHTRGLGRRFSDTDFFSKDGTTNTIAEEIPRIRNLKGANELDHYMLFSNRKLTGNGEASIRHHISKECGVPTRSIYLAGVERIEQYLRRFPNAATGVPLSPIHSPLIISPDELAEAVEAIALAWDAAGTFVPPEERVALEDKNQLNNVDPDYAREWRRKYLKDTPQIAQFLANPINAFIRAKYEDAASEIQLKMMAFREEGVPLERMVEQVQDLLFDRDSLLRSNKRLTRSLLFFMYWSCDIGRTVDDQAG